MRPLTAAELDEWYMNRRWPCCGGKSFLRGPRGGLSMNVKCPRCGTRINVIDPDENPGITNFGQMIEEPPGYVQPRISLFRRLVLHFITRRSARRR
jgi:hypothetical protein